MPITIYDITPIPKPRMTRRDRWKVRPCVARYRAFCDECRLKEVWFKPSGARIIFVMPMPKSWSKTKRATLRSRPHEQRPDLDNLCKSLFEAVYSDDSVIWDISIQKVWGEKGQIRVINP
jgi:Holliday junction resolvase RusA-like endonuclease